MFCVPIGGPSKHKRVIYLDPGSTVGWPDPINCHLRVIFQHEYTIKSLSSLNYAVN